MLIFPSSMTFHPSLLETKTQTRSLHSLYSVRITNSTGPMDLRLHLLQPTHISHLLHHSSQCLYQTSLSIFQIQTQVQTRLIWGSLAILRMVTTVELGVFNSTFTELLWVATLEVLTVFSSLLVCATTPPQETILKLPAISIAWLPAQVLITVR